MSSRNEQGFSLLEAIFVVSLIGLLVYAFSNSAIKNLQARKDLASKMGYEEVVTYNRAFFKGALRAPLAGNECPGFESFQSASATSNLLTINKQVATGLSDLEQTALQSKANERTMAAVNRCRENRNISSVNSATDNSIYFCARFKTDKATASAGGLLSSPHAFAEYRVDLINTETEQPISCQDFKTAPQASALVYYTLYWMNGASKDAQYSVRSGTYYVGK